LEKENQDSAVNDDKQQEAPSQSNQKWFSISILFFILLN
jgi:hypothetical protein